jgi:hypothetical protein
MFEDAILDSDNNSLQNLSHYFFSHNFLLFYITEIPNAKVMGEL